MIVSKNRKQRLTEQDLVGKINGCQTIISLDDVQYTLSGRKHWRYIVSVKCNRCGHVSQTTWDSFNNPSRERCKSCKYCKGLMMIETTDTVTGLTKHQRYRINSIRAKAKLRNLQYSLTNEEAVEIISKPCTYCGQEIADGIDRIDSSKGYTKDNCVPCCAICNRMKNKHSLEFFKHHIALIYKTIVK